MPTINLLFQKQYKINDKISILIPTVGEIIDNEEEYYNVVSVIAAMPIDLMSQLDDVGIDFTAINEFDLFLILFESLKTKNTKLIFGDLDLTKFEMAVSEENGSVVLLDKEDDIVIDKAVHNKIATVLRSIHHIEKDVRKPANEEAKKYMIKRAREKLKRRHNRAEESQLEKLIVAMVNSEQYKYDFEGTRELSIYQFNESVRQIIKKVDYEHKMFGVYTGNINAKELPQEDLNWLIHK